MFRPNLCIFLLAVFSLSFSTIKAQTASDASVYMSEVLMPFEELKSESWAYLKAVTRGKSARKVENKREKLIEELRKQKIAVKRVKPYEGDATLGDAISRYLELSYIIFRQDYDKILDMEAIAEQSYDDMEAYILAKQRADEKVDSAFALVRTAQENFAKSHGITLLEAKNDRIEEKIAQAGDALDYYNEIYLIFFRCYKQEAYVMDALGRNDIVSLEQNISSLDAFAEDGMKKLKSIANYKGDPVLKAAGTQMLKFYKNEAERDFREMADLYIKKDNFEKLNAIMESKKKKDITQEDIDKFNQAAKEYNEMIPTLNKLSKSSYERRVKSLEDWNSKVELFFDKYTS